MATVQKSVTYEEWLRMPSVEGVKDEVVNGEIQYVPTPHYPHADVIQLAIEAWMPQIDRKRVRILGSTFGLLIAEEPLTCRAPDIGVFWKEKRVIRDGLECAAPDLVIEVISPSETKRRKEEKIADYAKIGVPEVWLMSPEAQTVEVWLLAEGQLKRREIRAEGTLQPSRFPGVSIAISELWPEEVSS